MRVKCVCGCVRGEGRDEWELDVTVEKKDEGRVHVQNDHM